MDGAAETITEILIPYTTEYMMMIIVAASLLVGMIGIIAWKMQSEGKLAPFFGGIFMYLVFTACLKSMCDLMIGPLFMGSPWAQGVYEGLFWTLLQLLGIYFGFTAVHKDHSDRRMSVTFGLGFGWTQLLTSTLLSASM
ncbi:MAG: YhfC family intramembrane metalloprotease [Clostridia bacterium]|nr:YhfC family intramembrane metalloprotease [Clostridia bacterium]